MKKITFFMLMAVGLLISGNSWANYIMPEIEAKPAPEINEVLNTPNRAPQGDAVVVAEIVETGVKYASLQEAVTASTTGQTIKMLENVTLTDQYILMQKSITIDLNGTTMTNNMSYGFYLANPANLTVKNGIMNSQYQSFYIIGGKLVLENITVTASVEPAIWQYDNSEVTVKSNASLISNCTTANSAGIFIGHRNYNSPSGTPTLNIYGHLKGKSALISQGQDVNGLIEVNVYEGAILESTTWSLYWPAVGIINVYGGTISSPQAPIELRAGTLNVYGGSFVNDGQTISGKPNGSGATIIGAAIAVSQHTTKQPVIVNIEGGTFKAPMALIQVNLQNNSVDDFVKVKVNVSGGKFTSTHTEGGTLYEDVAGYGTVTYAADAMCISQNKRIFLMGGFYNYDPVEFVATGYKCYPITADDYPTEYAAGYRFRVGEIDQAGEQETTVNSGDWKTEATTVWQKGTEHGAEPTDETPVVITDDKQVVVTTPATAYSVTLGTGTSKLTVKEDGRLMVGAGGFTGTTDESFIVENGGQMAISPTQAEYQPEATVTFVADWAHRKTSADDKEPGTLEAGDLYWQHIATPLSDGNQPDPSEAYVSYVNTWNLTTGWTSATWANVVTPFVGYQVSSIKKSDDEKITYTFKGKLVGNHVDPLRFARIGFSFFGNSYLAPIDIRELLTCLESKGVVDPTVLLYDSENGIYEAINRASYYIPGTKAEIQPMQGFFVFAESATDVDFDYRKAVWDAFCAKANSGVTGPTTAPKMQENPFSAIACIDIKAEDGAADRVMLFECDELSDAEDKGYDARKMMTSGMNLYAKGSYADLAILATNNLQGSELVLKTDDNTNYTLSFANIKGEYALYDALTGRTINMTEGATYEFQAQANATITDRFYVVEAAKVPTQIDNVNAKAGSCKFMKNGVMFIERNNKVYNAQGQIVK